MGSAPPLLRQQAGLTQRLLTIWSVTTYGLLFSPALVIALFSFNAPSGRFNLLWQGFTLANWRHLLSDGGLSQAFLHSVLLAITAALLATLLALPIALVVHHRRPRGSGALELVMELPLGIPEVVLGVGLLLLFVRLNVARGWPSLLLAHTLLCLSYAALALKARLGGHDWSLEDAARDLGASPLQVMLRVTLPGLMPGLLAALLLSISISLDDVLLTSFTAGSVVTFPLWVSGAMQRQISPQIHVLSTLVLILSLGALTIGTAMPAWRRRSELKTPAVHPANSASRP
jgi:spermidine/putrescine transport system permease protein